SVAENLGALGADALDGRIQADGGDRDRRQRFDPVRGRVDHYRVLGRAGDRFVVGDEYRKCGSTAQVRERTDPDVAVDRRSVGGPEPGPGSVRVDPAFGDQLQRRVRVLGVIGHENVGNSDLGRVARAEQRASRRVDVEELHRVELDDGEGQRVAVHRL